VGHPVRLPPAPRPRPPLAGLVDTWVNAAGTAGSTGDGGAATSARMNQPNGMVVYQGALLLVAETGAHVIRAVHLQTRVITRWAGTGTAGSAGDGLDKLAAAFNVPYGMAALPNGDVLVASFGACRVIRITATGVMRSFAGAGGCTTTGDGSSALSATINGPVGVTVDNSTGTTVVYIAEYTGQRVSARRRWSGQGQPGWRAWPPQRPDARR
jgi:hypothetical protein